MPRRSCCCISRRACLYCVGISIFLFWATIASITFLILFKAVLPARRAHYLETAYINEFRRAEFSDGIQDVVAKYANDTSSRWHMRVQRLIQDVPQLHYWQVNYNDGPLDAAFGGTWTKLYHELLGINLDGTGSKCNKGNEYWVYLGGTGEDENNGKETEEKKNNDQTIFKHRYKRHACSDPKYICDMYNTAFDRVAERWHGTGSRIVPGKTSKAQLRFVDSDVSTLMYDSFIFGLYANPVMLMHVKIGEDCVDTGIGVERCPVTWRFLGLPRPKAPWTRQIRIEMDNGGSTVVPAFPDAEEQFWTLMAHADAYEGLDYDESGTGGWNSMTTTEVTDDPLQYVFHDLGIHRFGYLQMYWAVIASENPADWYLFWCEVTYWIDTFLVWWDGAPQVVYPLPCQQVKEGLEQQWKMKKAWDDVNRKMDDDWERWGLGPRSRMADVDWDEDDEEDEEDVEDSGDAGQGFSAFLELAKEHQSNRASNE